MYTIHRAEEQDIDRIAELEKKIFSDGWSRQAVSDTFGQKNAVIFGAYDGGVLVGYLIVYYVLDEGEIARIAVEESFRRQGAAGAMLAELAGFCKEKGITKLMLEVRQGNKTAIAFYKAHGFKEDGVRRGYYKEPSEDAVLMSRISGR